jgi:23S rRNA (adenine-N6)-dimethyltransferase
MPTAQRRSVRYSQNFLTDPRLVERLLDLSGIRASDLVYEIGPGHGIITARLARRCGQVVAVERDPLLAARLHRRFAGVPNVAVRAGDFLARPLPDAAYKVFANIPFNRTADIVAKLTAAPCPPEDAYLVVQREAADRFLGRPRETLRAVLLKPWFEPTVVHHFRRADFVPAPRVDVVMLRLRKRGPPLVPAAGARAFRDFVVYGFTAWQPSLYRALVDMLGPRRSRRIAHDVGLDPAAAPTAVPFAQWLALFDAFDRLDDARARRLIAGAERRLERQQAGLRKCHRTRAMSDER